MNTDKVLDDAREKIAKELYWQSFKISGSVEDIDGLWEGMHTNWQKKYLRRADQILAISGTTDIECPANGCINGKYMMHDKNYTCRLCLGTGTIKSKWELEVRQVVE